MDGSVEQFVSSLNQANHIFPHFVIMVIQVPRNILVVSLKLLNENLFDFHQHNERNLFLCKMKKKYKKFKKNESGKIWSPGKIWFLPVNKTIVYVLIVGGISLNSCMRKCVFKQ